MKKKMLILILSATALLVAGCVVLGIILIPDNNNPKTDTAANTTSENLPSNDSSNSTTDVNSSVDVTPDTPSDSPYAEEYQNRAEIITKAYAYSNEFAAPTFEFMQYNDSGTGKTLPYWIYVPHDYNPQEKYPVLLFLHGGGEVGNGTEKALHQLKMFAFKDDDNNIILRRAIIIVPHAPSSWSISSGSPTDSGWLALAMRMLFQVENTYSCDLDRIYISGVSMGSFGTWSALTHYSDHFAAAVPICGGGGAGSAQKFAHVPIWIFHGVKDSVVSVSTSDSVYNALMNLGSKKVKYSRLENVDHDIWEIALGSTEMWTWMFCQNKSTNRDASYSTLDYISVKNSKGQVLFNHKGVAGSNLNVDYGHCVVKVNFTDNAMKTLKNAYKQNKNEEFTLYFGGRKLFSFKFSSLPTDNSIYLIDLYSREDCYAIGLFLSDVYTR